MMEKMKANHGKTDQSGVPYDMLKSCQTERQEDRLRNGDGESYRRKGKEWECLICNTVSNSRANVIVHIRSHTGEKPYKCDICQREFAVKVNYTRHYRRHLDVRPYQCGQCNKAYCERRHLEQHVKSNHMEEGLSKRLNQPQLGSRVCDVCGKVLSTPYYLSVHMRVHSGEKPFTCQYCPLTFRRETYLNRHLLRDHKGALKKHACPLCLKCFVNQKSLSQHLRRCSSSELRADSACNLQCSVCHMSFANSQLLIEHGRSEHSVELDQNVQSPQNASSGHHSAESALNSATGHHSAQSPQDTSNGHHSSQSLQDSSSDNSCRDHTVSCPVCKKAFNDELTLRRHVAVHTGRKTYRCQQCPRAFSASHLLQSHISASHKPKRWTCPVCAHTFKHLASLRRHEAYHKGARTHACQLCCKTYMTKGDLRRHEKSHHSSSRVENRLQLSPDIMGRSKGQLSSTAAVDKDSQCLIDVVPSADTSVCIVTNQSTTDHLSAQTCSARSAVCRLCKSVLANDYAKERHERFCSGGGTPQRSLLAPLMSKQTSDHQEEVVQQKVDAGNLADVLQDPTVLQTGVCTTQVPRIVVVDKVVETDAHSRKEDSIVPPKTDQTLTYMLIC